MKTFSYVCLFVLIATSAACDWTGSGEEDDHEFHAFGLVLYENGAEIARYEDGVVTGGITVPAGGETDHIVVRFLDPDGAFIDEGLFTTEHHLEVVVADTDVARAEQHEGEAWEFHVLGEQAGSTTLVVHLMHGSHDDLRSRDIPVTVTEALAQ